MEQSPLQSLVVDESAMHDAILAELLRDWIQLTTTGGIVFKADAVRLSVRSRALIGILGGAALHRLGHRSEKGIAPKEIETLTGIPGGTLRPALRELASRRLVRSEDGRYEVPAYAIADVRKALTI
ncbi:MAG TPA: hypothetical protein VGU66_09520 [Candidatus Elarobacter sp.]|nr:hypothetical protein [Candidatus Elarobacter sp.]